jgi:hypothetical protein
MSRRVIVTDHAVDRFIERARPELYPSSARALLERQVCEGGAVTRELPDGWPSRMLCGPAKGYVVLPDDRVAVVKRAGRDLIVLSVLVRPVNRGMRLAFSQARHRTVA